jgi:transposase
MVRARRRQLKRGELFSYIDLGARVRRDHPLRAIRTIVNEAL